MNNLIIFVVTLGLIYSCTKIQIKEDLTCATTDIKNMRTLVKLSGLRTQDNFNQVNVNLWRDSFLRIYNRRLRKNKELEGVLSLNITIGGDGQVVDIKTTYSNISDCYFIKKIHDKFYQINYGPIGEKDDISIFPYQIEFIAP